MNIIIVGCGKLGSTLADLLNQEKHDVTLIDTKADVLQNAANTLDVMGIVGNGASHSVQQEAGIEAADLLIAVTSSDELNLLCCLIAKKAGNCHTIARVRNPVYSKEISFIKEELGLSLIINPEYATAAEIARLLKFPSAIQVESFAKGKVEMLRVEIAGGSKLHNVAICDLSSKFHGNILVCAVERGEDVVIPSGDFVLQENDKISFIVSADSANEFFKKTGIAQGKVKETMIVGGGTIAFYLATQLLASGIHVKIIEKDRERCDHLSDHLPEAMIICGDGTDEELLLEEGIDRVSSFVSLTDLDEENILLAMFAKSQSNAKRVTKINRISFENIIKELNLGSTIYPKHIISDHITQYVRAMQNSLGSNVETMYRLLDNRVEALEFVVRERSAVVDVPLQDLNLKHNLLISCINRNGKIIIPSGKDEIRMGDTVIVVTTITGLNDIKNILK